MNNCTLVRKGMHCFSGKGCSEFPKRVHYSNGISTIAYDTENICVYSFVHYMIKKTEKVSWIQLAIDVMLNPLCFLEGAYSVALFHARELLLIKRDVENLERILFFYNIPEKLIDEREAQFVAEEILKMEPDNEVALKI